MRRTKSASRKRSKSGSKAESTGARVGRIYQDTATTGLNAIISQQISDEMRAYSERSIEQVFNAWRQFLDTGRQVVELQTRYAQNANIAYEAYVDGISKLEEVYLNASRRVSKPLAQGLERAKIS
jgi:hypothetical protein